MPRHTPQRLHPGNTPTTAHPYSAEGLAEPTTPQRPLPPGIDTAIFTAEQLDYLSDLYTATMVHHLRQFYALLRAMPPYQSPTCERVGINAALLCKILRLTEGSAAAGWKNMHRRLGVNGSKFSEQRRALFAALKNLQPKLKQ